MGYDNYDNQLRMLDDFGQNLITLKNYLEEIKTKYKAQINAMESAGFMQDYTNVLESKYHHFSNKINEINSLIERQGSKIGNHKDIIENLRVMARSE